MNEQQKELAIRLAAAIPKDMLLSDIIPVLGHILAFICTAAGMDENNLKEYQSIISLSLSAYVKTTKDLTD